MEALEVLLLECLLLGVVVVSDTAILDPRPLSDCTYTLAQGVSILGQLYEFDPGIFARYVHKEVSARTSECVGVEVGRCAEAELCLVEMWWRCGAAAVLVACMCCTALCIILDCFIRRMCPTH